MSVSIELKKNLTTYSVYYDLLPQISKIFSDQLYILENKEFVIDLSEVYDISPEAIPNVLIIAELLNHFFDRVDLLIPRRDHPKYILYMLGFSKNMNIKRLLNIGEDDIGGFSITQEMKFSKIDKFQYDNKLTKDMVETQIISHYEDEIYQNSLFSILSKASMIFVNENINKTTKLPEHILESYSEFILESMFKIMKEILTNACFHSGKNSDGSICYCAYHLDEVNKELKISISDDGVGLFRTLNEKKDQCFFINDEYLIENNGELITSNPNLLSILDAVSFRVNKDGFGIYDAAFLIAAMSGKLSIHSDDVQCLFTKDLFFSGKYGERLNCRLTENKDFIPILKAFVLEKDNSKLNNRVKKCRETNRFKGVHVEIRLPLDEIDWEVFNNVYNQFY